MNGICGWIGRSTTEEEQRSQIMSMISGTAQDSSFNLHTSTSFALAAVGKDILHHYDENGGCVIYGHPYWRNDKFAEVAIQHGFAYSVMSALRQVGGEVLKDLFGAFSLAAVLDKGKQLILAIDRMGVHSLTYTRVGDTLVFATNADELNRHKVVDQAIDPQAIFNYVYFHVIPGPQTIYQNQFRLLPGTYLYASHNRADQVNTYWRVKYEETNNDFCECKHELFSLLRSSVEQSLTSKKVGAFLSGGTDSSTVAGMLASVNDGEANTYSIGFNAPGYDEMEYARIASRHFNTNHHEYYVTPDDVVSAVPIIAAAYDQPFGNASAIPTFYCAKLAKSDGIDLLLGGDGGDEIFGGNARYAKQWIFSLYEHLPQALRKNLVEPLIASIPKKDEIGLLRKLNSYIAQASEPMPARMETYNLLNRLGVENVFDKEFLHGIRRSAPLDHLSEIYHEADAQSLINRMLAVDLKLTLADNDLRKVMTTCNAAEVEVAFPMLNDELVAFSTKLPSAYKLKGTQLRYFFKKATQGFLPMEIINKEKHGFGLPFGLWLKDHKPLTELANDCMQSLKKRNIIKSEFIDTLTDKHLDSHAAYYGTMIWLFMMLEHWFGLHESNKSSVQSLVFS